MSWQNAPRLEKLTAAQQGGKRGAQLWGVDYRGTLHTIYQKTPGGEWSNWLGPDWAGGGFPKQVYELASCQQNDGRVILFTLDLKRRLRYISQQEPGGDWTGWHEFDWSGTGEGLLTKLTAVQRGVKELNAELWAITSDGEVYGAHQWLKEGRWFQGWYVWPTTPEKSQFIELAAARQHNGHVALWGIDTNHRLWFMNEDTPDSPTPPTGWGAWQGPNWQSAPKLRNIAAVRGAEGAILWGIDEDYRLIQNWQDGKGKWYGWSHVNWLGAPHCHELTAAGQNNNCVQVWAVTLQGKLTSIAQKAPACNWGQHWSDKDDEPAHG
jgi:hypothetical protein